MLTGAPPSDRASTAPAPRRRVWPWAAGSILITLAVIAATLVGHRLAAQARLASQVAPAPAAPPLAVEGVIHVPSQVAQLTLDAHTHTLVAQVQPTPCPPTPLTLHCGDAPNPVSGIIFYDSATGAVRAEHFTPSSDPGESDTLTDTTRGVTYLLEPSGVTIFSDATGQPMGNYASQLASDARSSTLQSVALDEQLGLLYALNSSDNLSAYNASDGQQVATTNVPSPFPEQVFVDASANRVYGFLSGGDNPGTLFAYSASDLTPLGSWQLPQRPGGDFTLGPLGAATHTLYLWGPESGRTGPTTWMLDLATLPAKGFAQAISPQPVPELAGASALGFDGALTLLMTQSGVEAQTSAGSQPYAGLPLIQASEPSGLPLTEAPSTIAYGAALLPIDASAGLAYLPGADNTILIVSLARPASYAAPNAATAALIARAGMAKLLPDTNQDPPFITAQTFPLSVGKVTRNYFIHYSDLGWKGPYAGTASIGGVTAGATPGDYTMTFAITWNQLFLRQHSWTVEVTPDGRTHLLGDSGDAIP